MELTQLIQFRAIAQYSNITKAAEYLHISQPGLSAVLRKLEGEIDAKLFYRTNNRLQLTPAGQAVLSHTNKILSELDLMKQDLALIRRKENDISAYFCSKNIMWYYIPIVTNAYPEYSFESRVYEENDRENISLLTLEKADILITSQPLASHNIESKLFLSDNLLLSVPKGKFPQLEKKKVITESDLNLLNDIYFLDQEVDTFCQHFRDYFRRNHLEHKLKIYTDTYIFTYTIQHKEALAISSELVKYFHSYGPNRILIPFDIPDFKIQFYSNYLKINKRRLRPFLSREHHQLDEDKKNRPNSHP